MARGQRDICREVSSSWQCARRATRPADPGRATRPASGTDGPCAGLRCTGHQSCHSATMFNVVSLSGETRCGQHCHSAIVERASSRSPRRAHSRIPPPCRARATPYPGPAPVPEVPRIVSPCSAVDSCIETGKHLPPHRPPRRAGPEAAASPAGGSLRQPGGQRTLPGTPSPAPGFPDSFRLVLQRIRGIETGKYLPDSAPGLPPIAGLGSPAGCNSSAFGHFSVTSVTFGHIRSLLGYSSVTFGHSPGTCRLLAGHSSVTGHSNAAALDIGAASWYDVQCHFVMEARRGSLTSE